MNVKGNEAEREDVHIFTGGVVDIFWGKSLESIKPIYIFKVKSEVRLPINLTL